MRHKPIATAVPSPDGVGKWCERVGGGLVLSTLLVKLGPKTLTSPRKVNKDKPHSNTQNHLCEIKGITNAMS